MPFALRRLLLTGCALSAILAPALARAQLSLDASAVQVSAGGQAPTISRTGQTTDITLNAPRTIIGWSSYNLASDQTVIYRFQDRSGIVLNKVGGQAFIDGQIETLVRGQRFAGNVWFSAPGGVIFGPNAQVNVGGLLATPATVGASFLDPSTTSFDFTGAGQGPLTVRAGAQLRSGGGALALVAANVTTEAGSTITGSSGASVLYGAANDFTVRFAAETSGDLDLVDFVVPAAGGTAQGTPLSLQGQTVGGSVFLAVVSRSDVANAVINAPGLIAAQSAIADHGDVVLSAGGGLIAGQPGSARTNTTTTTAFNLDIVTAQRDLLAGFAQPTTLTANQLTAGRDVGIAAATLNAGALHAGRFLAVNASQGITLGPSSSAGSNAVLTTDGGLVVGQAGAGSISAAGSLAITASTVQAGALNAGRSLIVTANGAGANGAAAVTLGSVLAGDDVTITSTNAAGGIALTQASDTAQGTDAAPAGRNLILTASGASADVAYGGANGTALNGFSGVQLSAGRNVTANVNGMLTLTRGQAGATFLVRAMDLDIQGPITATDFRVESLQGALTLGGGAAGAAPSGAAASGTPGLTVTNAEFQNITTTGTASFYAGSTIGAAPRGDLTVLDLAIDPARMPRLLLGATPNNDVTVVGVLAPTVNGGVLAIGDASGGGTFQPGRILVSGSIGFATGSLATGYSGVRAFHEVDLAAVNDIILGSSSFIGLVSGAQPGDIDISHDQPVGVLAASSSGGQIFLTADVLSMQAATRILQANTGSIAQPNGLLLINHTTDPVQIVLTTSRAQVVDLFGVLADRNGNLRSGALAGASVFISGGGGGGEVRLNGQNADLSSPTGSTAIAAATTQAASQVTETAAKTEDPSKPDQQAAAAVAVKPAPLITIAQPALDAIVSDPVELGTGSEEVWRAQRNAGKK